ncbi:MAG: mechanosensitive ion channel [Dehalococcoidales bacterium]|nr:mechanosensitive ion channel [Dehalococcoidales bacterium]MDD4794745.1 mechanosensitive ion channel [Dehalococcoidales bacterium]MDD5122143.1 mechanosensitive ion channel [Dehalococcoidales bacterium]MDD5498845.1 mechanosensitive ion channel [Dehalococcoidales bacterium]
MPTEELTGIFLDFEQIDFLRIFIILAVTILVVTFIDRLLPWIAGKVRSRLRMVILPWTPLVRLLLIVGAFFMIIPLIIVPNFQNFVAILGAVGVAVGFAFKDYASALIGGILAVFEKSYRPGDWITVDGAYGEVKSVGLRAVQILTPDDTLVSIPHNKMWNTNIYNENSGKMELQCAADFYLEPEHDAQVVRDRLYDVALTSPYLKLSIPVVVVVSEKPWYTHYKIRAFPMDARDQFQFISDLTVRGKAALIKLGVKPVSVSAVLLQTRS